MIRPDSYLTVDCEQPILEGRTWRDVASHAVRLEGALDECTGRMREIRN